MADGRVSYAREQDWHVLRYQGRVDYTMAPAIERHADGVMHGDVEGDGGDGGDGDDHIHPIHPFVFDLCEARLIDSTNLGLMARLADRVRASGGGRSVIVSIHEDIDDVLTSMGFAEIFDIVTESPILSADDHPEEQLVTGEPSSQGELLRTMLEAHRTLAGLNERDNAQFKDVVSMLEAQATARR